MPTVLMTGFPGFLGSELARRILARSDDSLLCVVQAKFADQARRRVDEMGVGADERVRLVEGDITLPGLGLADPGLLLNVTEVHHLAAAYDLAVSRELGMKVNVEGTRAVLDVCAACPKLRRLHYVSTCYVSGRHAGIFSEDDLSLGQAFNNHYEETKYLAEVLVRERMGAGLPATVYRPSIVVGDSHSGATQKLDGPYYLIMWLLRQARVAVVPQLGDPSAVRFNMVPRDFVVDAIAHLSALDETLGHVYQLADPRPPTVEEMLDEFASITGRRLVPMRFPRRLGVSAARRVERWTRIPADSLPYFAHPTHYATWRAQALLTAAGITCPAFTSYARTMVEFTRANPQVSSAAMV